MSWTQKQQLIKWNDATRYSYNTAISYINDANYQGEDDAYTDSYYRDLYPNVFVTKQLPIPNTFKYRFKKKTDLRDVIIPKNVCIGKEWLLETPKATREGGVFSAYTATDTALKNWLNGHTRRPNMYYQSKRTKNWTITIPKTTTLIKNDSCISIYPDYKFGDILLTEKLRDSEIKTNDKTKKIRLASDTKIHYDGQYYYLLVVSERECENKRHRHFVVSSDPGIHKFNVFYDLQDETYLFNGDRASESMMTKLKYLDKLTSQLKSGKYNRKKRKAIKNHIYKIRKKIKNLQMDIHYKTSKWLCDNYRVICIPKLNKKNDMIKKKDRSIHNDTVRKLVIMSHCKFIERLKAKAESTNTTCEVVTEEYTSQVCSRCSRRTKTKDEIYICKHCKYSADRDVQGSKNVLFKNLYKIFDSRCKKFEF